MLPLTKEDILTLDRDRSDNVLRQAVSGVEATLALPTGCRSTAPTLEQSGWDSESSACRRGCSPRPKQWIRRRKIDAVYLNGRICIVFEGFRLSVLEKHPQHVWQDGHCLQLQ